MVMPCRRVVIEHTTGRFSGLRQIMGTDEALGGILPAESSVLVDDRQMAIKLAKTTERYALYREIIKEKS